jgi:histidine triad (HIT) family protein
MDCIFCKIIKKEIPSEVVYEDENFLSIKDINPMAKSHFLVFPKKHVKDLEDFIDGSEGTDSAGRLLGAALKIAQQKGLLPSGFRTVINTGVGGGQTVFHLHLHVLGGEPMTGSFGK